MRQARPPTDAEHRYWQLSAVVPSEVSGTATSVVRAFGALGALEQPLDDARTSLTALFDDAAADARLVDRVRREFAARGVRVSGHVRLMEVTGGDWAEAWPEYLFPVAVGRRLLVTPPWIDNLETDRTVIVIEPGGFGTGHHPTTAGCLAALERIVERDRPGDALDLGTGSGILAIAAAKLGVARVLAIDHDPRAVAAAAANVERNGVSAQVRCEMGDAAALDVGAVALVAANLLAAAHRTLAARYVGLVTRRGSLILGGIEEREAQETVGIVGRVGFVPRAEQTVDGWTTLVFSWS